MWAPGMPSGSDRSDFPYTDSNNPVAPAERLAALLPESRVILVGCQPDRPRHPTRPPWPRRAPSGARVGSRPTATSVSTTGTGCGTRTTRRSSRTSRPRTPTPRRPWPAPPGSAEPCSTRWWPGSRRPTCRCRSRRGPGSTTAVPSRAAATGSTAGGRPTGRPRPEAGSGTGAGVGPGSGAPEGIPADEQVLLDENELAEGHDYFAVGQPRGQPGPPLAGLLHRHHRRRAVHHAVRRPRGPATCRPRPSRTRPTAWPGPTTTPPSSTCGWTKPCAPTSCGATGWGPTRLPTRWSTRRRTTASTSGSGGPRTTATC